MFLRSQTPPIYLGRKINEDMLQLHMHPKNLARSAVCRWPSRCFAMQNKSTQKSRDNRNLVPHGGKLVGTLIQGGTGTQGGEATAFSPETRLTLGAGGRVNVWTMYMHTYICTFRRTLAIMVCTWGKTSTTRAPLANQAYNLAVLLLSFTPSDNCRYEDPIKLPLVMTQYLNMHL